MERKRFIWSILLLSLLFATCKSEKGKVVTVTPKYTCPMHPQIIKEAPGLCPICGMDLVKVHASTNKNELTLTESQMQLANIKTVAIASSNFNTSKILNGRLVTNPELTEVISSRYAGRIEKLYVKETGRAVSKGQPLFQIYSEELQTLQQDYLLQVKQVAAFPNEKIYSTLKNAAKNKLSLFGYSSSQIENLARGGTPSSSVTVRATASGIVNEVNVSEGQYVTEGSAILRLEDLSQLWVEADVYPDEVGSIKLGTAVQVVVDGFPELKQTVKINFISPQLDPSTQLLKVRALIPSQGKLQPGMQVAVLLPKAEINDAVSLPLNAVIRDEMGAHVWVKTGKGKFVSKMVTTGDEDERQIIITSGLADVKEVVISGAYLLSSEYILKKGTDPMAGHDMSKM
ncbi:efflux RND transporter periplasmic adaptor subunit [Arcticibacter eurypsychrophilus]|uniref:efflux RND transporter periplasmic adaptor subunit n=1 Tax=Arcticibacter eurypsychrophilus TaxID=1434752 RepID=UPI00084DC36B|nr:efflux RND transporter periplasmic adaptor subunit [Arcticibacter eurypsychrophilus]